MVETMIERFENGERPCLTPAQIERLAILAEELGEAQQIVGKILRHGFSSYNPFDPKQTPNKELLEKELGDVEYAMHLLVYRRDLDGVSIREHRDAKAAKTADYIHCEENISS